MSNTSISAFSLQSTLPKDSSGYKFLGWVRSDASVAPFTLPRGIGTSVNGSGYMFSSLGVGTWTGASPISPNDVGMGLMGLYIADHNASLVDSGQAQFIKSTHRGELIVSGACKIPIMNATSTNIYTLGSGLLYGGYVTFDGATTGDQVLIENGDNTVLNVEVDGADKFIPLAIPQGGLYFSTSIIHTATLTGGATASVTIFVDRP